MIFMTSNLGAREMGALTHSKMGFQTTRQGASAEVEAELTSKMSKTALEAARRKFTPEFINRIDKIAVFRPLGPRLLGSQLRKAASSSGVSDSIRMQQVADPVDMTQEATERDLAVQILERESMLVRRLRSAIDRIANGSYYICMQCEEEIAPKRLSAMPWAERSEAA
jgi:RNA polymerase-binding transcription factor DksA